MVKRYDEKYDDEHIIESEDGDYVLFKDYEHLQQRLATAEAVSRNRLETILLIHGCYFDACSEADSILFDLSKAEAERDQAIKEIERIGRELGTTQAERDNYKNVLIGMEFENIEQLGQEKRDTTVIGKEAQKRISEIISERDRLKAENERLSEALEEIENTWPLDGENAYLMADTAKAALRREVDGELSKKT